MPHPTSGNAVPTPRLARVLGYAGALGLLGFVALTLHTFFGLGGAGLDSFFDDWLANVLIMGAAASCLLRGMSGSKERAAWTLMGLGIGLWATGSLIFDLLTAHSDDVPIPSLSDAFWLPAYPTMFAALVLLVRSRTPGRERSLWLDGAIGALAIAAVTSAFVLEPIMHATEGSFAVVATGLAYVGADLILLILVTTIFGLSGWRLGRGWILVGLGLVLLATADFIWLMQTAEGTYVEGRALDAAWPAAFLLIAFAAWHTEIDREPRAVPRLLPALAPALGAITAVVLLAYDHFTLIPTVAVGLASLTLAIAAVRLFTTFLENERLLQTSQGQALHDALTGLGNRRLLMHDLEEAIREASPEAPVGVLLFDLNGFKQYNDTYGHPAGDQLLALLGSRLHEAVLPQGRAYRLGGDEFCAVIRHGDEDTMAVAARGVAGLSEKGEGFSIDSAHGLVSVPGDAEDIGGALALADARMYAQKGAGRASASRQTRDVLMKTLFERQPGLHTHLEDVAALAVGVARRFGLTSEEVDEIARAAELHDVGKMAIPDAILNKPVALDETEWAFMERHTIIGERILGAALALIPVARIVRSTHERFDGTGYPDRLARTAIPLGARIVFVCDAFHAMTSERPYGTPRSSEDAVAELRRCSGTQFDPDVVEAFCESLGDKAPRRSLAGAPRAVSV